LCAHVTVAPDVNRSSVLSTGIDKIFIITPLNEWGGHSPPNSFKGVKQLWKYPQKKEKKNIISESINNNIPS
jgi:hypothetical protein